MQGKIYCTKCEKFKGPAAFVEEGVTYRICVSCKRKLFADILKKIDEIVEER